MKSRTRARIMTALAGVAAIAAAVLVVGPGYDTAQVRLRSGTVWLASSQTGEATLVDGASSEVKARVRVAAARAALTVAQRGSAAVVLNRKTGQMSSVDSATEQASPPVDVLPASDGLAVLAGADALYAVDVHSGLAASVDPATLTPRGEPGRLAESVRPDNVVVDGGGRLWAIDDTTGDLVWLDRGERRTRSTATRNGRLTITDGKPALVDPERGTAELLDPETGAVARSVRLDLPAGVVAVGGSADRARLLIATDQGELSSCAFDTGCTAPVKVSSAGAELGTPVEVDDHAVVPDYSTGQATIVALSTSRTLAQRQLFDKPTRFELITHDGIVFFNDPDSNAAGVLELSGDTRTITKYTSPERDTPPAPDPPAQADRVTKIDRQKQKPGLELPSRTDRLIPPNGTAPAPTASIVVKPGNHGVVGDEFELTARLQPASDAQVSWSFGDGTEAAGTTVRHTWRAPGVFTVRATVSFATGKQVVAETTITVDPAQTPPRVIGLNLRPAKPVMGQSVHFRGDVTGSPEKWAWSVTTPGRPTPVVTAQSPEFDHVFATPGIYTVSLTTTSGGQTSESSKQLIVSRGAVKVWGASYFHQAEVPDAASSGVIAVEGGYGHCLALKANGSVIAWGTNIQNQTDVPESALSGVVAISSGSAHSLALKADGSVIAWGYDGKKQATVPQSALSGITAISAGGDYSLALTSGGKVIAWGSNEYGQTAVPDAATSGVTAIAAGNHHALALKSDGSVITWGGLTWDGQERPDMQVPPEAMSGVVAVAAGSPHSMVLKADGTVIRWVSRLELEPPMPPEAQSGVVSFDTGSSSNHSLAMKSDGSLIGWGLDTNGETSVPPEYSRRVLAYAAVSHFSMVVLEGID